ncbi:MAG: hypothetical protein JWN01_1096 [Patescibacteria group bacterium]|nr:hypothetical protein [Patescibacteria group bacterium]
MNIIVYGSLMKQASLEATLGRTAVLTKVTVPGYNRVFNAPFDNYAFLNLQFAVDAYIEAAYFELKPAEIANFGEREAGSELVEVKPGFFAFIWPADYVAELPVLQSYVNFCEEGASVLGIDMRQGFITPQTIVDDTLKPLYA